MNWMTPYTTNVPMVIDLTPRKWILPDSPAYTKLCSAMLNKSLTKGIKQASPLEQTSCLEGFHSVVNQFSPKMNAYSFSGIFCRHILAAIHFNYNLFRVGKKNKDGSQQVKITYPKFKDGNATVREVKVNQNFGYVEEIYQTYITACSNNTLEDACMKLKQMTPAPMNTMFEKETREVAIKRQETRKNLVVENVPSTTPLSEVLAQEQAAKAASRTSVTAKAPPRCSVCKNVMKGHKNVQDCPRNQKTLQ